MPIGRSGFLVWFVPPFSPILLATVPARAQLGLAVAGIGPINRSMGGPPWPPRSILPGALFWTQPRSPALGVPRCSSAPSY